MVMILLWSNTAIIFKWKPSRFNFPILKTDLAWPGFYKSHLQWLFQNGRLVRLGVLNFYFLYFSLFLLIYSKSCSINTLKDAYKIPLLFYTLLLSFLIYNYSQVFLFLFAIWEAILFTSFIYLFIYIRNLYRIAYQK